jgi:desulfoferrodoxin (superoxide reductase-like protein)
MNKEIKYNYLRLSLALGIIVLYLLHCTGNEEEIEKAESRLETSDSSEKSISPQKEYTKANPAEWKSEVNDHLPEIIFNKSKSKENITVKVLGKKFSERHYIEVIGIMDEHSADIDLKYIDRGSLPTAILSLNLRDYNPENVKVFAKCNLHDLWTVPLVAKEE